MTADEVQATIPALARMEDVYVEQKRVQMFLAERARVVLIGKAHQ